METTGSSSSSTVSHAEPGDFPAVPVAPVNATNDGEREGNLVQINIHIYIYTFNTQYCVIIYPSQEK
jgi:hypothetical protein